MIHEHLPVLHFENRRSKFQMHWLTLPNFNPFPPLSNDKNMFGPLVVIHSRSKMLTTRYFELLIAKFDDTKLVYSLVHFVNYLKAQLSQKLRSLTAEVEIGR